MPKSLLPLQIFRAGTHVAMSGAALAFSETDLAASAAAYDPALHEAPLVVGHPAKDAPAYGWVKSLQLEDGALEAQPDQIDPAFAEMVRAGRFKKISASFYPPSSPQNPVPGVYYLRHVGFLGAQPPAVKGLRAPEFAESDDAVTFEFGEWDDLDHAALWRGLREWMIGKFSQDEADKVIPGYTVQRLEQSAQDEIREAAAEQADMPAPTPTPAPTPIFSEQETAAVNLDEKNALEARIAQLQQQIAAQEQAKIHAGHTAFAEGLVAAGQLLPAQQAVIVATLDHLAAQPADFGEGDSKAPLLDAVKTVLAGLPRQVEFGEVAPAARAVGQVASVDFAAPAGYTVDGEALALHQKALAHAAQHKIDYLSAVKAVSTR